MTLKETKETLQKYLKDTNNAELRKQIRSNNTKRIKL